MKQNSALMSPKDLRRRSTPNKFTRARRNGRTSGFIPCHWELHSQDNPRLLGSVGSGRLARQREVTRTGAGLWFSFRETIPIELWCSGLERSRHPVRTGLTWLPYGPNTIAERYLRQLSL